MESQAWFQLDQGQVFARLGTGPGGLDSGEAKVRLERYGPNELTQARTINPWEIFLGQFAQPLVIILIIAALVSGGIAYYNTTQGQEGLEEWIDAIVILAIVVINAILGFLQEYKAEQAIQALKALAAPRAKVLRDGERTDVPAREVVPGDVILLESGDKVPADGRLVEVATLKVNEASLTGESVPVTKSMGALAGDLVIGDRTNMVFLGSAVEYGRGRAVVVATGMATELGRVAGMVQEQEPTETPLQRRLERLGKQLGGAILAAVAVIFAVGFVRSTPPVLNFLTAVSLAVAAIPEGLPAVVTITLALGLQRMARRKALLRRLPAAETLGSATVICSDKTGTLTLGEMNVTTVFVDMQELRVEGTGYAPEGRILYGGKPYAPGTGHTLGELLRAGALNNDAALQRGEKGWAIRGDATEGTLLVLARRGGLSEEELRREAPRVGEIPFSSDRKRMTTLHQVKEERVAYVKGAPEIVLERCDTIMVDGKVKALAEDQRKATLAENQAMASRALRVLALARRVLPDDLPAEEEVIERDLTFLGLVGMIDAPREDAKRAIAQAKAAGIRVVMITGDHSLTAKAIAQEMGILQPGGRVLVGEDLNKLSDEQLEGMADEVQVYARVAPEHKVRIVEALRKRGHVVAMTGDGVNDAPALKKADLGIAMGITGTDVAKEASDMVLTDDNFAAIVDAVEEGRGIFENIRKFVAYLLSANVGEILIMFSATLLFAFLPFLEPIQLLWINLVTDGLPALALGVDPIPRDIMARPPRNPRESPLSREVAAVIVLVGVMMALGTLGLAAWEQRDLTAQGRPAHEIEVEVRTVAFTFIVVYELLLVFAIRNLHRPTGLRDLGNNPKLVLAVATSMVLQLAVLYIPAADLVFQTSALDLLDWLRIGATAAVLVGVFEAWKLIQYRRVRAV